MVAGDHIDLLKTHAVQIRMSRRGRLACSRLFGHYLDGDKRIGDYALADDPPIRIPACKSRCKKMRSIGNS